MIIKAGIEYAKVLSDIGAETLIDSHKDSAPVHEIDRYVKEKYNVRAITNELSDSKNIYHIIKYENEIAGFSKMMLNSNHPDIHSEKASKMDQIYLLSSFQGLKLGAKLLHYNIELSKANRQTGMWLIVWVGNHNSISFYEKFGFKIIADDDFHLTDTHTSRCHLMFLRYATK